MPRLQAAALRIKGLEYKWLALLTVSVATFTNTLDVSIINISLPRLSETFGVSASTVFWVALAYMLTMTGLMLSAGRLSDTLGRNRLFLLGVTVSTAGLGLCALSQNVAQLILFRVIQATGAALVVAVGTAIVTDVFPSRERGRALGIQVSVVGGGLTSGPVLGGILLDALGWRSLFYIRLPIALLSIFMAWRFLKPESRSGSRQGSFDLLGAITLFLGLGAFLLTINQGQARGWTSPFILAMASGAAIFISFFLVRETRIRHPVLDIRFFQDRLFAAGTSSLFVAFVARMGVNVLTPFFLIQSLHFSPSTSGLVMATIPLSMLFLSPASGLLSDRLGSRPLCVTGMVVITMGLFLLLSLNADSSSMDVVLRLLVIGIGSALFESPNISLIMGTSPKERLGTASAVTSTLRSVGQSAGLALAGAIFAARQITYAALGEGEAQALAGGFHDAILVALPFAAFGILTSSLGGKPKTSQSTDKVLNSL